MKKLIILLTSFILSLALHAESYDNYVIETGQFDKINVVDNVNVVYRCLPDSTGFAQFRGAPRFADAFILSVKDNGTLKIQVSTEDVNDPELPVLYVYSDFLVSAESSSILSLTIENPAPCAELKFTEIGNGTIVADNVRANKVTAVLNTGNGTVNVSGECETAVLKMIGAGLISADRLKAKEVNCRILGTGSIGCWPEDNLSIKGLGSTKIYYKGNPKIKKSGGGKLFELPEEYGVTKSEEHVKVALETEPQKIEIVNSDDEEEEEDEDFQTVVTLDD